MKSKIILSIILLGNYAVGALAQGTLVYDQQSTTGALFEGTVDIQSSQPVGQSFTPALNSVGFVQLFLEDGKFGNSLGAVIYVNLRMDSISGTIVGQTLPVALPDGVEASQNFLFSTPVSVTPGTTYYFQPVVQSGDPFNVSVSSFYHYSGGSFIFNGTANPAGNLYFREGILVPEPSTWALLVFGSAALWLRRRKVA